MPGPTFVFSRQQKEAKSLTEGSQEPESMMQRNGRALRWGVLFLILLVQAEAIQLSSVIAQAKMGVRRSEKTKALMERLESSEATSFAEMSESLQSEVVMHQL